MATSKKFVKFTLDANDCEYVVELLPKNSYKICFVRGAVDQAGWQNYGAMESSLAHRFAGIDTLEQIHESFTMRNLKPVTKKELFVISL